MVPECQDDDTSGENDGCQLGAAIFYSYTFVISLISVPYNAAIIAHEKMSAFAYISILEAAGKLAIAFLIMVRQ